MCEMPIEPGEVVQSHEHRWELYVFHLRDGHRIFMDSHTLDILTKNGIDPRKWNLEELELYFQILDI